MQLNLSTLEDQGNVYNAMGTKPYVLRTLTFDEWKRFVQNKRVHECGGVVFDWEASAYEGEFLEKIPYDS